MITFLEYDVLGINGLLNLLTYRDTMEPDKCNSREEPMQQEILETDVLCVGGGIAGLMAAIRASELGARVIVAEKGNTIHSGCGRAGNDHFWCYIPEVHGPDIEHIVKLRQASARVIPRDINVIRTREEKSFDIVKLWDSWGIPMKYDGKYEFAGFGYPGSKLLALKYDGHKQKTVLTEQALKRGVNIVNRVMVYDLLCDGGVAGAIGINTREDKITVFRAKAVILGTGCVERLYPSPINGRISNPAHPANLTGDGRAMAYRAGAELVGLETPYGHCGPKYFAKAGQATWVGVVKDAYGKPVGPFVTEPDKRYGDVVLMSYPTLFEDYAGSGRGPIYMDCTGISQEDYEYMLHYLKQEGNDAILNHLEEEGIDPRKNPIEFMRYDMRPVGGVHYNEKGETNLPGLYAAGDEVVGGIATAAIFGWIAGENMAEYVKGAQPSEPGSAEQSITEVKNLINKIKGREAGADWKEMNFALQQVLYDYAGSVRSETLLQAGLNHFQRLKRKAYTTIAAKNQWELIRCLEVLNLFDLGELIFIAAGERKETRGKHVRPDYPVTNPKFDRSLLFIKKVDGKAVTEWREIQM